MRGRGIIIWSVLMLVACAIIFLLNKGLEGYKLGRDLSGGARITYQVDLSEYDEQYPDPITRNQATSEVVDIIVAKIDRRVGGLGVSDHKVYPQLLNGKQYVTVELGGVDDLEYAKKTIGKTLELTFLMPFADAPLSGARATREASVVKRLDDPSTLPTKTNQRDDLLVVPLANAAVSGLNLSISTGTTFTPGIVQQTLDDARSQTSAVGREGWRVTMIESVSNDGTTVSGRDVYYAYEPQWTPIIEQNEPYRILNGAYFSKATITQDQLGAPAVGLDLNTEGTELLCEGSKRILNTPTKAMAISVGDEIVSVASVREPLCGSAQITGVDDPKHLQAELNEGAFPAPLILSSEEVISATLGASALHGALIAGAVALLGVAIYMFLHYGWRFGVVGLMILVAYLISIMAITKLMETVYSLSGIAAIVLSIGMAVDALIIMFSRIEEEQHDHDDMTSIERGHQHSISAIRDGNITTALIGIILFVAGTNFFKGFGAMLLVTITLTLGMIVPLAKALLHDLFASRAIATQTHHAKQTKHHKHKK